MPALIPSGGMDRDIILYFNNGNYTYFTLLGIGYAICESLLKNYNDVTVLLGSRDANRGKAAVEQLLSETTNEKDRIQLVVLDTTSTDSIQKAAENIDDGSLYGIVNNAGIGHGNSKHDTLATNYWGVKSVTETFLPKLQSRGRIVMISSASAAYFLMDLQRQKNVELFNKLGQPWNITGGFKELDDIAETYDVENQGKKSWDSYGLSKALLNAYTYMLSRQYPNLVVNAITPGFIKTDLTVGLGASKSPSEGAVPAVFGLTDVGIASKPQGRFYGSDCKRSPLDVYRDPGTPEYDGPDGPTE